MNTSAQIIEAGLSLGSNMGDRLLNLQHARDALGATPGLSISAQSPLYETDPVGVRPEYANMPYLNAVLIVETQLPAMELSATVHRIEDELGRQRSEDRYAPRVIDIDILYIAGLSMQTPELQLPHPNWASRRFVVQPLADVRPALVLPGTTRTCADVLSALPAKPEVIRFVERW